MTQVIISQRHSQNQYGDWIDSLENNYINCFESIGIKLIPIPNSIDNLDEFLDGISFSGIILSGGGEVHPELYGKKLTKDHNVSETRDQLEYQLIEMSIKKDIPLLGICRGMQLLNVYFGGTLSELNNGEESKKHLCPGKHNTNILDEHLIDSLNGESKQMINSYHNQGIFANNLAQDLSILAQNDDVEIIEAFSHNKYAIGAVQWHPERNTEIQQIDKLILFDFINRKNLWK